MFDPLSYDTKTQETLLLGITHYEDLIKWCNDDSKRAYHLLDVFFNRDDVLEKILITSVIYSYYYAKYVLKGPFALGEETISKDTIQNYPYYYAKNVLHGRFVLGEEAISKDAGYAYKYSRDVLKSKFELGEDAISKDSEYAYYYARDILKGPFVLGEDFISKHPEYSYRYARFVLKGRFVLGEEVIMNSKFKDDYLTFINQ